MFCVFRAATTGPRRVIARARATLDFVCQPANSVERYITTTTRATAGGGVYRVFNERDPGWIMMRRAGCVGKKNGNLRTEYTVDNDVYTYV